MWNGTMFVDLDWPLNASSLLSASAELLVLIVIENVNCTHPISLQLGYRFFFACDQDLEGQPVSSVQCRRKNDLCCFLFDLSPLRRVSNWQDFLPRDTMRKARLCCCRPVRVCHVCIRPLSKRLKIFVRLLPCPGSPIILVSWCHPVLPNS